MVRKGRLSDFSLARQHSQPKRSLVFSELLAQDLNEDSGHASERTNCHPIAAAISFFSINRTRLSTESSLDTDDSETRTFSVNKTFWSRKAPEYVETPRWRLSRTLDQASYAVGKESKNSAHEYKIGAQSFKEGICTALHSDSFSRGNSKEEGKSTAICTSCCTIVRRSAVHSVIAPEFTA